MGFKKMLGNSVKRIVMLLSKEGKVNKQTAEFESMRWRNNSKSITKLTNGIL
jgi:hypothetical protein